MFSIYFKKLNNQLLKCELFCSLVKIFNMGVSLFISYKTNSHITRLTNAYKELQMRNINLRGNIQESAATIEWSKNWCSSNWQVVRGQVRNYERLHCRCWKSRQQQVVSSGCCALLLLVASHVEKWRGALRVVCAWLIRTQRGKYVHTVTG